MGNFSLPTVVHCKKAMYDVYIGRPRKGQPWCFGNPFSIPEDGDRDEVIEKYESWLRTGYDFENGDATQERRQWIINHVHILRGKVLGCWCSPLPCHGEILAKLATEVETRYT